MYFQGEFVIWAEEKKENKNKNEKKREMKKRELLVTEFDVLPWVEDITLPLTSRKVVFAHDNESLNHECFDRILRFFFFVLPLFRLLFNLTTKQMGKTNKQTKLEILFI